MHHSLHRGLFLAILFLSAASSQGQEGRFRAGLVAGMNASQIDGDLSAGYNRFGIRAGVRVETILSEKVLFGTEIAYSQRGSQNKILPGNNEPYWRILLPYVEVPLTLEYLDWKVADYSRVRFLAGLTYSRLLGARVKNLNISNAQEEFSDNDFGMILGGSFFFNRNLGLNIRYNRSMNRLFDAKKHPEYGIPSMLGYFFSFEIHYLL